VDISYAINKGNLTLDKDGGGIVGKVQGSGISANLKISYTTNEGSVTSSNQVAGGIVGVVSTNATVDISNSTNLGDITGITNVGGIVGNNNKKLDISNTTNSGIVNSTSSSSPNVGGIVGSSLGGGVLDISFTTNNATVSAIDGNANSNPNLGGIVGNITTKLTGFSITVTGPGTTIVYSGSKGHKGHIIGNIQGSAEVNLTDINVNRPDSLKLVGTSVSHDIKEGDDETASSKPIFTDASIKKITP